MPAKRNPARQPARSTGLVCTGCSLLCDDLGPNTGRANERRYENLCQLGQQFLAAIEATIPDPEPRCDGQPASRDQFIEQSARRLQQASFPVLCGLADQSSETVAAAIQLASAAGAVIDWTAGISPRAWHTALQLTGRISCSISEMNSGADLVIVWGADPATSHPRLLESYAGPVWVIAEDRSTTAARAERWLNWSRGEQLAALRRMRELANNLEPTGIKTSIDSVVDDLFGRLSGCQHGVVVVGDQFAASLGQVGVVSLSRLIRKLNDQTRCSLIELTAACNARGAGDTMSVHTGAPFGVLFRDGEPYFQGETLSTERLLEDGGADLVILISHQGRDAPLIERILRTDIPVIAIGNSQLDTPTSIATARWAWEEPGRGIRTDGTPVAASSMADQRNPALPGPVEILHEIARRMGEPK